MNLHRLDSGCVSFLSANSALLLATCDLPCSSREYLPLFRVAGPTVLSVTVHHSTALELLSGGIPIPCPTHTSPVRFGCYTTHHVVRGRQSMDFTWHFGAGRMIPLHSLTARLTGVYKTDLISTRLACRFTPVLSSHFKTTVCSPGRSSPRGEIFWGFLIPES